MTSDLHRKLIRFDTAWDINEVYDALTERDQAKAEIVSLRAALELVLDETGRECYCSSSIPYTCGRCKAKEALAAYTQTKTEGRKGL